MSEKRSFDLVCIGLGNPGLDYVHTRHNIGERVVKAFAEEIGIRFLLESRFKAQVAKGAYHSSKVALLFPITYMNLSGEAIRGFIDYYKIAPSEIIVLCDDVDLPLGMLRLRKDGRSGGHNGLKSIEKCLGTQDFARLRIGVGAKHEKQDLADHVLGKFTNEEALLLPQVIENAVSALKSLVSEDMDKVMSRVNQKVKQSKMDLRKEGEENCHESKKSKPL